MLAGIVATEIQVFRERHAQKEGISIAYQVVGDGPFLNMSAVGA
jgi:hypothetical protein